MIDYKFDSEYLQTDGDDKIDFLPIFTFNPNFEWNKRGINLNKNKKNKEIRYDRHFVRQTMKDIRKLEKKKDGQKQGIL